jgi:hypothetical protein
MSWASLSGAMRPAPLREGPDTRASQRCRRTVLRQEACKAEHEPQGALGGIRRRNVA